MKTDLEFPWPSPKGVTSAPRWIDGRFEVDGVSTRVLAYESEASNWSGDLTTLHENEAGREHPIDRASRKLAVASMRLAIHGRTRPTILDVGCSSGFVLEDLASAIPGAALIGADYLRGPLEGLGRRMPTIPILQFDLRRCPLPDACVDGVTCLNVLEHIDDDDGALKSIYRILKPGGIAHVEVPAGPRLFDIYDEHLLHYRRYRMRDLKALAARVGFSIARTTHLGFFVYPAFWWVKRRNRRLLTAPAEEKAKAVTLLIRTTRTSEVFSTLIRAETAFGSILRYPFGIRCVVMLRKT